MNVEQNTCLSSAKSGLSFGAVQCMAVDLLGCVRTVSMRADRAWHMPDACTHVYMYACMHVYTQAALEKELNDARAWANVERKLAEETEAALAAGNDDFGTRACTECPSFATRPVLKGWFETHPI